jgi:ribosomal protein L11 methyltransferase
MADDDTGLAMVDKLQKLGMNPQVKHVQDSDWENNWRDFYKPMEIGQKLVVVPEWEAYEGDRTPVKLDPGLLFGTGDHPTTQMCLTAVEQYAGAGKTVVDIGCGSGILGIAAAVLGSETVIAADVDEKAPDIVRENAELNGVADRFTVYVGDVIASASLRQRLGSKNDLVLANIVADVIIPLAPHVPALMGDNGIFVCSGIIDGREDEVEAALAQAGLAVLEHKNLEEWHCFVCRKEKA